MERLVVTPDGAAELTLSDIEVDAIRSVTEQLLHRLQADIDEDVRRLFPPAYPDDPKLQDDFWSLTHGDLVQRKLDAAKAMIRSIDAGSLKRGVWVGRLDRDTVAAWVHAINDARLVIGTRLDVTEEMEHTPLPADHPDAPAFNMYLYLGGVEELLVHHLIEHDLEG